MENENNESIEGKIDSGIHCRGTESTSNNTSNNAESSSVISDNKNEKSLEYAEELMERGSKATLDGHYADAIDCYDRALKIRVEHFGKLSPECVEAYYKFGCTLLFKAQKESLATMPKKEGVSNDDCNLDGSIKSVNVVPSVTSIANSSAEHRGSLNCLGEAHEDPDMKEDAEVGEVETDAEKFADGDEAKSDLDLAWTMLEIAWAIVDKHSGDTTEKSDILSALAEVALKRDDVELSRSEFLKSLSILERVVEPDSQLLAQLNFRICLCLEIASKPEEAVPYCQKAISVCKSKVQRLMNEVMNSSEPAETRSSESTQTSRPSCITSQADDLLADNKAEIETLTDLCADMEKKLEDLQQFISNPTSILGMTSAKAGANEKNDVSIAMGSSQMDTANRGRVSESPTVSTAHTSGASETSHTGIEGRGIKRVLSNSEIPDSNKVKQLSTNSSADSGEVWSPINEQ